MRSYTSVRAPLTFKISELILARLEYAKTNPCMIPMPTEHCAQCKPEKPCGGGHVYVIELGHGIGERSPRKHLTHLFVGQTKDSVEERMQRNLTLKDEKTVLSIEEARANPGGNNWKLKGMKIVRSHYVRHRPDLYEQFNPLENDVMVLKDVERRLTRKLEREKDTFSGLRKYRVHGVGKVPKGRQYKRKGESPTQCKYRSVPKKRGGKRSRRGKCRSDGLLKKCGECGKMLHLCTEHTFCSNTCYWANKQ
uniref:Uncharacterized protein n=1 Tax=uncultured marine group II/III euryarchaeote AD1000_68_A10 TaxID=1457799 RepID=A0A075FW56_9EURY|nr:hypothetical protein [uncultured marine group II/III euryarchaeote AD1000_68_A10]